MKKILIIGKKSFLGSNLKIYLSKFYKVEIISFDLVLKKKISFFLKFTHIINTAIHPNYVNKKYNAAYDLDRNFLNKFNGIKFKYIFLSSRKIYKRQELINEKSPLQTKCNYSKNKLITEKFLKHKFNKNILILRCSNILGRRIFSNVRNSHKLFFDNFLDYRKNNKSIVINNDFKDFLSIEQFCLILKNIIKYNLIGTYNVSLGKKIYISEILSWLDLNFSNKVTYKNLKENDSFTLSNKKLIKKIKIKLTKKQVKLFCQNLV